MLRGKESETVFSLRSVMLKTLKAFVEHLHARKKKELMDALDRENWKHADVRIYRHTYIHTHVHACTLARTRAPTHTHTHTHSHTHASPRTHTAAAAAAAHQRPAIVTLWRVCIHLQPLAPWARR